MHKLLHQPPTGLDTKESDDSANEMFSIGSPPAEPFTSCPEHCHAECNTTCPGHCCASFCPKTCASDCLPDCPVRCCKLKNSGLEVSNSPLTESSKMKMVKEFKNQFCSRKCKTNCDNSCPPVCCHGQSLFLPSVKTIKEHAKEDATSKSNMNWSMVMKFLDNLYNTYGHLNKSNHIAQSLQKPSLTKPAVLKSHDSKLLNTKPLATPTVRQPQPVVISDDTPPVSSKPKAALTPTVTQPKPVFLQDSNPNQHPPLTRNVPQPKLVPSQSNQPVLAPSQNSPLSTNHNDPNKPFCSSICKIHCFKDCHPSCCVPWVPKLTPQPVAPQSQDANFKNGYDVSVPPLPGPGSTTVTQTHFSGPGGPPVSRTPVVRPNPPAPKPFFPNVPLASHSSPAPTRSMLDTARAPLCLADCAPECYPGCTYRCCVAGQVYQRLKYRVPAPKKHGLNVMGPPKGATCLKNCSRACYPSCDPGCCQANARNDLSKPPNPQQSGEYSIKVPCTPMCRPYNCLAYCHHDCCLRPSLKRTMLDEMYKTNDSAKPTASQVKAHIAKINNLINGAHQSSDVHSSALASTSKSSKRKSIERHHK